MMDKKTRGPVPGLILILLVFSLFFIFRLHAAESPAPKAPVQPAAEKKKPEAKTKAALPPAEQKKKELESEKAVIERAETTLKYGINKDRKNAITQLAGIKSGELKSARDRLLLEALKEERDPEVKIKIITVAGDLKIPGAGPEFVKALSNDSEEVRIAAVNGLKALKDRGSAGRLIEMLNGQDLSRDTTMTETLISALAGLGALEMRESAEQKISDPGTTRNNRQMLILFLGTVKATASQGFLVKVLKDTEEDPEVRAFAASALARMDARGAAPDLNAVIKEIESYPIKKKADHYTLYIHCVAALAMMGDQSAYPHLVDSLRSDNAPVRLKAIKLMKGLKDQRSIDILRYKRDHDPSPSVQRAAREALAEMGVDTDKNAVRTPTDAGGEPEDEEKGP